MSNQRSPSRWSVGRLAAVLLPLVCLCGCATRQGAPLGQMRAFDARDAQIFARAEHTLREVFPNQYSSVHRAIITVRAREFVCDGFLTVSPVQGWHLALISTLGLITEVRVRADGSSQVLKVSALFREAWSREHVVPALRWLFAPPPRLEPAGRLADGRIVLEGSDRPDHELARYVCSPDGSRWEALEVVAGARRICHMRLGGYRSFAGLGREVPAEIELRAGTYQLHLRIVALDAPSPPWVEASR